MLNIFKTHFLWVNIEFFCENNYLSFKMFCKPSAKDGHTLIICINHSLILKKSNLDLKQYLPK